MHIRINVVVVHVYYRFSLLSFDLMLAHSCLVLPNLDNCFEFLFPSAICYLFLVNRVRCVINFSSFSDESGFSIPYD